jgi:FKBP-type peptidyl-prolyl cis-trans isomerase
MGVQVEVLEAGDASGRKPGLLSIVHCHYTGRLQDGTIFDSSASKGKPLTFILGIGQVIRGWDEVRPFLVLWTVPITRRQKMESRLVDCRYT